MSHVSTSADSTIFDRCKPFLDRLTAPITAYLQAEHDHPRQWLPRANPDGTPRWTAVEDQELRDLCIPALPGPSRPPYDPDLLLYRVGALEDLDKQFSPRFESITSSDSHSLIVNTSGTGKTRLLFETLSRHWGLYFTCYSNATASPYGSIDIHAVLNDLPTFRVDGQPLRDRLTLRGPGSRASKGHLHHNQLVARTLIYGVLVSRLLVFNHVCTIGASLGLTDEVLRRRWFLIQLRPHECLQDHDFFSLMAKAIRDFPAEALLAEADRALADSKVHLQFIALDEAQTAMHSCGTAFATTDGKSYAPVLHQLVHCMATLFQDQRILVAGTQADLNVVSDAVSGLPSPFSGFKLVYSLGCFDSVARTTGYLRHFFGETMGDDDCREVHSLFQGRHRFLALFVAHVLVEGFSEMDRVVNALQKLLTGYSRPGSNHVRLRYNIILEDLQLDECWLKHVIRHATFRFALRREPTVVSDDAADIVALGIGVFCDPHASAMLFEPLIFYRLLMWIRKSKYADIGSYLRPILQAPGASWRGVHVAAGLASYFWPAFSGAARALGWCFSFAHPAPVWASRPAQLVLPSGDRPAAHAVSAARSPDEVIDWLRVGRSPFLIPDAAFGVDLLFWLQVEDAGTLLVALTTDPFAAARPHRVSTVSPKDPSSYYAESPVHQQQLMALLRALPHIPFEVASGRRPGQRLAMNVLRVLCVARASVGNRPYNPPVATVDVAALLTLEHAPELEMSILDDIVWESVPD